MHHALIALPLIFAVSAAHCAADKAADVIITLRGTDAFSAFNELHRRGGPRVVRLAGSDSEWNGRVHGKYLFKPVLGRELIEAVAVESNLKVAWLRDIQYAVLYAGAAEKDIEHVRLDLTSADVNVRRKAAWSAGWLQDVRIIPLLGKAVQDTDRRTAEDALLSLKRMGWHAVMLLLDEALIDHLFAALAHQDLDVQVTAADALIEMGGKKDRVEPLLLKALADKRIGIQIAAVETLARAGALYNFKKVLASKDDEVCYSALLELGKQQLWGKYLPPHLSEQVLSLLEKERLNAFVINGLSRVNGVRAIALLEKALADEDVFVRRQAAQALGRIGGAHAVSLLEEALTDKNEYVRENIAAALGEAGGDMELSFFEKALTDKDAAIRRGAVSALGKVGGEQSLSLLEMALWDQDSDVRNNAALALGRVGGVRARTLLEKALLDADENELMRLAIVEAMKVMSDEQTIPLLEKSLEDPDKQVQHSAIKALSRVGGDKVLAIFEKALDDPDCLLRKRVIEALADASVDRKKALLLLEKIFTSPEDHLSPITSWALSRISGPQTLAFLEKCLADKDAIIRGRAAEVLGQMDGGPVITLLETALTDKDAKVRGKAVKALGGMDDGLILALLEKAFADRDAGVRAIVTEALAKVKGLPLLKKALADPDDRVIKVAAATLVELVRHTEVERGNQTFEYFEQILAGQNTKLRAFVATALSNTIDNRTRDLLLKQLATERDAAVLSLITQPLFDHYRDDAFVKQALKEAVVSGRIPNPNKPIKPPPPPEKNEF